MRRHTILVADDHAVFVDGIVRLLTDHFDVVGTVGDGSDLIEAAKRLHPDVIVLDISMPGISGLEVLRRLHSLQSAPRVVVLTMHAEARFAAEAFRLGARGFVLKQCSGDELVTAIQSALQGHTYIAAALTEEVMALAAGPVPEASADLSLRQREVLRLIVSGQRMKEIAAVMDLSPRTVETIKYEMMRTLNVHSTPELVRYAIERRLVAF
jgi:DNA-binding NarL/FixJ family response regulator